jgi:N-acetylglucosaminyl-diphospho-decaprenol L-rhamnosyltransferase
LLATVDALIVSYNTISELQDTLESLLRFAPAGDIEFNVTVLDNGSVDGSPDMVEQRFPDVELLRSSQNLGFGKANNLLADRSTADYLLLVNSDVIVERDIVSPLLAALLERPEAIAAGPRLRWTDGRVQRSAHRLPTMSYEFAGVIRGKRLGKLLRPIFDSQAVVDAVDEVAAPDQDGVCEIEFLWATCWLLRRKDVEGGQLFSPLFPMYDEDLDFCRRATASGRKFVYLPDVDLVHIGGASTTSSLEKLRLMRKARRQYYGVHYGWFSSAVYTTLVPLTEWIAVTSQQLPIPGVLRKWWSRTPRP